MLHRRSIFHRLPATVFLWLAAVNVGQVWGDQPDGSASVDLPALSYNRDIRPLLAEKCFACHGTDSATREAGLRLDVREQAIEMGAIQPGDPAASTLVDRIHLDADDDALMPPKKSHKSLSPEEKDRLVRWIAEGAAYQPPWSLIAPVKPAVPTVQQQSWVRNPIDSFVLAQLESAGLQPTPQADRRTLARRAALDVTGLPPDPQWVDEFVNDPSPDAYEQYLDRLMSRAGWGEHRGRYWLDYARYADTHGIHFDNYREIWAYRDWVIDAFNRNQPFDQFSIEQLAGDLLENPTLDQQIATGFHRCNMTTNEGGIIDEEYAVLYARDRTETTSAVWLGLTTGCAVCHDHKFDPISMKEFYALSAFFNNTTQPVRDGNVHNTPPIIVVPQPQDRGRWNQLQQLIPEASAEITALQTETRNNAAALQITVGEIAESLPQPQQLLLHAPLAEGAGDTIMVHTGGHLIPATASGALQWSGGHTAAGALRNTAEATLAVPAAGDFEVGQPFTVSVWVHPERAGIAGSVVARMDEANGYRGWDMWLNDGRIAMHLVHQWPEIATKVIAGDPLPAGKWSHLTIVHEGRGSADSIRMFVDGVEQTMREVPNDTLGGQSIRCDVPLTIGRRSPGGVAADLRINDVRIYQSVLNDAEVQDLYLGSAAMMAASVPAAARVDQYADTLSRWWLAHRHPTYRQLSQSLAQLQREQEAIRSGGTIAHVMHEKSEPATAWTLSRGEYDQRLEQVAADTPAVLPPLGDRPRNRLGLAQWLFSDEHPLTARVTVNRFWQEVFGTGLVGSSSDFGVMGDLPSHPELLDYLAVEFRDSGWDVKALFRLMLTSATYQQSAQIKPQTLQVDPANRMLSRGPRYRMDAEMLRDTALWAGGLLSPKIGGPSVRPYQPPGVWEAVAMPGSDTRQYQQDAGDALYRRSMYTFWKRAAPPASMEILGAPNREVCTIQRERTNTPLQALVTLNDPQFIEAARKLAVLAADRAGGGDQDRLQLIAARLLSRPLSDAEMQILDRSLQRIRHHYQQHPDDAKALVQVGQMPPSDELATVELASWTLVASELMNLDETLNK